VNLESGMEYREKLVPIGADLSAIPSHVC